MKTIRTVSEGFSGKRKVCVGVVHMFVGDLRFAMSGDLDDAIEEAYGNSDEKTFCKCYGYPKG